MFYILDFSFLQSSFLVSSSDGGSGGRGSVTCLVSSGQGVWAAVQGSPLIRLFHAVTHECLCEASVSAPVSKMLAGMTRMEQKRKSHRNARTAGFFFVILMRKQRHFVAPRSGGCQVTQAVEGKRIYRTQFPTFCI